MYSKLNIGSIEVVPVSTSPAPAPTDVTVPDVCPVLLIVDIPVAVVDIAIPSPCTKPVIPVLETTIWPVDALNPIPVPWTKDSTALVAPSIVIITLPFTSDEVETPAPVKSKLDTSLVIGLLLLVTPMPADTVGTTHWLSPRRKVVADGVPVAASPIV